MTVGSTTAAATDALFEYVDGGQTVTLLCRQTSGTGATLDPNSVLWARSAKAVTAVEQGCGS